MKDYQHFTLEEFITDEDFIRWVQDKNPVDEVFWRQWLNQHPDKRSTLAEARRILESVAIEQKIVSRGEINQEIGKLLRTIRSAEEENNRKGKDDQAASTFFREGRPEEAERQQVQAGRRFPVFGKWTAVAATIITLAGIAYAYFSAHTKTAAAKEFDYDSLTSSLHLVEKVNVSDRPDTVLFADGSLIRIAPHSRISFQAGFDSAAQRDIYLLGEAFFQVAKNPRHPFRVFAGGVVTKVLGTSFCIRSFEKDTTIQVTVKTGKVSVYDDANPTLSGNSGGIILTPNQRLVYEKTAQKFHKVLLERPSIVDSAMTDQNMAYIDTPLEQVFDQLSKVYGIIVVYDNELLKKCTVTADLKGETFYHKLDLICRAVGAQYEVIDGQVVIQSNGCQ